jgi:hypothetical protein
VIQVVVVVHTTVSLTGLVFGAEGGVLAAAARDNDALQHARHLQCRLCICGALQHSLTSKRPACQFCADVGCVTSCASSDRIMQWQFSRGPVQALLHAGIQTQAHTHVVGCETEHSDEQAGRQVELLH